MHPDATDNVWMSEAVYSMAELRGLDLAEFISELTLWKDDGFTNIDWEVVGLDGGNASAMFFVQRQESDSDRKERKQREKAEALVVKAKKESEERKLYAKLKKKYGG